MYDKNSVLIAAILFVFMLVAIELGSWIGRRLRRDVDEPLKTQTNAMQASLLGILALLLGFTFSQSLQRFDARSAAVVDEANAIGTVYLRAQLLPESTATRSMALLREYLEVRIRGGSIALDREDEREAVLGEAAALHERLWALARESVSVGANPATVSLYINALNEMMDSNARRDAALNRHVPELVLFLLFGTFILTGGLVGYAAAISGGRASFGAYILVGLIVVLVFIIIDLDRPRRGLIEVDQSSLTEMQLAPERL